VETSYLIEINDQGYRDRSYDLERKQDVRCPSGKPV
jgi:hypothetical protein